MCVRYNWFGGVCVLIYKYQIEVRGREIKNEKKHTTIVVVVGGNGGGIFWVRYLALGSTQDARRNTQKH